MAAIQINSDMKKKAQYQSEKLINQLVQTVLASFMKYKLHKETETGIDYEFIQSQVCL